MENLKGFMYSIAAKCEEITIFDQNSPLRLNTTTGPVDHVQFLFKCYSESFLVAVNAIWPWQKQNSDFQFWPFP